MAWYGLRPRTKVNDIIYFTNCAAILKKKTCFCFSSLQPNYTITISKEEQYAATSVADLRSSD